ncbi:MAG: hypothetical protein WA144_15795 [Candidatus Methanoperedens sp.]
MRDPENRKLVTIIFIISFLWMLSPIYLPDEYSGYIGEEKEMIEKAVDDADVELGPIQRFSVKSVTRYDSEWEIKIIHYTIFNIPVRESNITVVLSDDGFHAPDGSFTDLVPFASGIILLSALATYFTVFALPILSIGYLINKKWRFAPLLQNPKVYGFLGYILVAVPSLFFFFRGISGNRYYPAIHTETIGGGIYQPFYLYLIFGATVAALGCYRSAVMAWLGSILVLAISISLIFSAGFLPFIGAILLLAGAAVMTFNKTKVSEPEENK